MRDQELKVYAFNDVFVVADVRPSLNSEDYIRVQRNEYKFTRGHELISPSFADGLAIFDGTVNDVSAVRIETSELVETYVSAVPGYKDLSKEQYEKLTTKFKREYREVNLGSVENEYDADFKVSMFDHDFDREKYKGEKVSDLAKLAYGDNYAPEPSMRNFGRVSLDGKTMLKVLKHMYDAEGKNLTRIKADFNRTSYFGRNIEYDLMTVQYLSEPYTGQSKKVYKKKQNGQLYADRRYTLVPDMPKSVSTVVVAAEDLSGIVNGKNDEENMARTQELFDAIFKP